MSEPMQTMEEYLREMIEKGYIANDLSPLKCFNCECEELKDTNEYYEDLYRVEYSKQCVNCNTIVGHWSYGGWEA